MVQIVGAENAPEKGSGVFLLTWAMAGTHCAAAGARVHVGHPPPPRQGCKETQIKYTRPLFRSKTWWLDGDNVGGCLKLAISPPKPATNLYDTGPKRNAPAAVCQCLFSYFQLFSKAVPPQTGPKKCLKNCLTYYQVDCNSNWALNCVLKSCLGWDITGKSGLIGFDSCTQCTTWVLRAIPRAPSVCECQKEAKVDCPAGPPGISAPLGGYPELQPDWLGGLFSEPGRLF